MLSILITPKGGSIPEAVDQAAFFYAVAKQRLNRNDKYIFINDKQYDYSSLIINGVLASGISRIIGVMDASVNPNYPAAKQGDGYYITVSGSVGGGGGAGMSVNAGDFIYALSDNAGGSQGVVGSDWAKTNTGISTETSALYVDATFGNDTTAEKNSFDKKFKTIAAAQVAATPGDTIIAFPGIYTEMDNLGLTGLTYAFPFGATVIGSWNDGGNAIVFNVIGSAIMQSGSSVLNFSSGSLVNFQCQSIIGGGDVPAILVGGGSRVVVEALGDISNTSSDTIQTTDANTTLYVTANRILSAARACAVLAGTTTNHKQYVVAKEVILSGASSCLSWSNGGYQELRIGRCLRLPGSTVGAIIIYQDLFISSPTVRIFTDFNDSSAALFLDFGNNNGKLEYNGDIIAVSNLSIRGTNCTFRMNGDISMTADSPVVTMSGGKVLIRGKVYNASATANAHGIEVDGGTLVLDHATIVTTLAGTLSINSAAAQNVVAYSAFANMAKAGTITIVAGTLTVDANVQ